MTGSAKRYTNLKIVFLNFNKADRQAQSVVKEKLKGVFFFLSFIQLIYCIFYPARAAREGKVIGRGVHIYIYIYICLWSKKIFESYFRDRLTFSNVDSRTSR